MAKKSTRVKALRIITVLSLTAVLLNFGVLQTGASGSSQWTPTTGVEVTDEYSILDLDRRVVVVRSDFSSQNYYIIIWADDRGGDFDIYGQRYDQNGTAQWTADGKLLVTAASDQPNFPDDFLAVADGSGGAIIAWLDDDLASNQFYAKRIDEDGDTVSGWTATGVQISTSSDPQKNGLSIFADGSGGAFIAWAESDYPTTDYDIYARHIQSGGTFDTTWDGGSSPRQISSASTEDREPQIVTNGAGGAIITYEACATLTATCDLTAVQITSAGASTWASKVLTSTTTNSPHHKTIYDSNSGIISTYFQNNSGVNGELRVNRLDSNGDRQWGTTGTLLNNTLDENDLPRIISDNDEGAIIVWRGVDTGNSDIYIQRVDSSGAVQWTAGGLQVSTSGDAILEENSNSIVSNGNEGAIVVFQESPGANSDVYAQHINGLGQALWTSGGELVETSSSVDRYAWLAGDDNASAVFAWIRIDAPTANYVMTQFMQDSDGAVCAQNGTNSFCGTQIINSFTLTFTDIPDSFAFATITEGATQDVFNNDTPPHANEPATDDLLGILDDRGTQNCASGGCGGFTVDVQPDGTFTDGTHTIPLTNLYIVTTLDPADPNNSPPPAGEEAGVTYTAGIPSALRTVEAPAYVNVNSESLTDRTTFTDLGSASQFGGSPLVLMDGTLPSTSGRDGTMTQFASFHLRVDATQEDGDYHVILTYTLQESTT